MFRKNCGGCGREVASRTQSGDRCPHCGVRFGATRTGLGHGEEGCLPILVKTVAVWAAIILACVYGPPVVQFVRGLLNRILTQLR
jgi:hypothetical protein